MSPGGVSQPVSPSRTTEARPGRFRADDGAAVAVGGGDDARGGDGAVGEDDGIGAVEEFGGFAVGDVAGDEG